MADHLPCLACSDKTNFSGCVGCGAIIPVPANRAAFCSEACFRADIIGAAVAPRKETDSG